MLYLLFYLVTKWQLQQLIVCFRISCFHIYLKRSPRREFTGQYWWKNCSLGNTCNFTSEECIFCIQTIGRHIMSSCNIHVSFWFIETCEFYCFNTFLIVFSIAAGAISLTNSWNTNKYCNYNVFIMAFIIEWKSICFV